ncbi:hypothetical protein [Rothia mucilaginosa]|uniref:hypothetical protein n=1 Tax=Rothia mucilaginosa TaxID=43675 RepID=UPI0026EEE506|nr:hypothetical protein [Rothia mucilaginosa]
MLFSHLRTLRHAPHHEFFEGGAWDTYSLTLGAIPGAILGATLGAAAARRISSTPAGAPSAVFSIGLAPVVTVSALKSLKA